MPEWPSDESGVTIRIDHERCSGAAECVDVCPAGVYDLVGGKGMAQNVAECIQCLACDGVCPEDAIWHSAWSE